jgi:hypothetical protein
MSNSPTSNISNYVKSSKSISLFVILSIFFIFIFMFSPLSNTTIAFIGRLSILILLGYAFYQNCYITFHFSKDSNIVFTQGSWNNQKTNVICSYVLSLFILLLLFRVVKSFFY